MSAFSGTLVGQDPSDEPASTLLERIAVEIVEDLRAALLEFQAVADALAERAA